MLALLRAVRKPVVTTLHTVSPAIEPVRAALLEEVLARSARVVVLTERSASACRAL